VQDSTPCTMVRFPVTGTHTEDARRVLMQHEHQPRHASRPTLSPCTGGRAGWCVLCTWHATGPIAVSRRTVRAAQ